MSGVFIESGISLDPAKVTSLISQGLTGVSDALLALAAVSASTAIAVTIVRGYLAPGRERAHLALLRVMRIALFVSLIAFISWGFTGLVASMGFAMP